MYSQILHISSCTVSLDLASLARYQGRRRRRRRRHIRCVVFLLV